MTGRPALVVLVAGLVLILALAGALLFTLASVASLDLPELQLGATVSPASIPTSNEPIDTTPPTTPAGHQVADRGRDHLPEGRPYTGYLSLPPTSGPHWPTPATWGVYTSPVPDERAVHNLEHGGIVVSYKDVPDADLKKLLALRDRYPRDRFGQVKILIRPYPNIASGLVLTAWNWVDQLDAYDERRVLDFMRSHMNECCEAVP